MQKTLDAKLEKIRQGRYQPADFIIADAKDGDMGNGIFAPGPRPGDLNRAKSFPEYLDAMREMTRSGGVDIMLMSASAAEELTREGLFEESAVTPAVRLNDTSDIWGMRHASYKSLPARNYRSADLEEVNEFVDLGLYSVTFSNDLERDLDTLNQFQSFLEECSFFDLRYFLEVFNPQFEIGIPAEKVPEYVNDCIVRTLAGLTSRDRPLFLKMPFNGAKAMEELSSYNPGKLIVGVLGGAQGTTRDTFELVRQSERHGARVALFGRKINLAEAPLKLVEMMRAVVEGQLDSDEAVRAYHGHLQEQGIAPLRPLEDDLQVTEPLLQ
ncbi:MAG: hypothetical protein ACO4AU_13585 [bacterium]